MTNTELKDQHDWRAVQVALYDLMAITEENEPDAVNFINAIEEVLGGLPEID